MSLKKTTTQTLSVYRSRFEALSSIGSAIFAQHMVRRTNNATENAPGRNFSSLLSLLLNPRSFNGLWIKVETEATISDVANLPVMTSQPTLVDELYLCISSVDLRNWGNVFMWVELHYRQTTTWHLHSIITNQSQSPPHHNSTSSQKQRVKCTNVSLSACITNSTKQCMI